MEEDILAFSPILANGWTLLFAMPAARHSDGKVQVRLIYEINTLDTNYNGSQHSIEGM